MAYILRLNWKIDDPDSSLTLLTASSYSLSLFYSLQHSFTFLHTSSLIQAPNLSFMLPTFLHSLSCSLSLLHEHYLSSIP